MFVKGLKEIRLESLQRERLGEGILVFYHCFIKLYKQSLKTTQMYLSYTLEVRCLKWISLILKSLYQQGYIPFWGL